MRSISILLFSAILISVSARPNDYAAVNYPYQEDTNIGYCKDRDYNTQVSGPPGSLGYNPIGRVTELLRRFNGRLKKFQTALRSGDQKTVNEQYVGITNLLSRMEKRADEIEDYSAKYRAKKSIEDAYRAWEKEPKSISDGYDPYASSDNQYSNVDDTYSVYDDQYSSYDDLYYGEDEKQRKKAEKQQKKAEKQQKKAEKQQIKADNKGNSYTEDKTQKKAEKAAKKQAKIDKQAQKQAKAEKKLNKAADKEEKKRIKEQKKQEMDYYK